MGSTPSSTSGGASVQQKRAQGQAWKFLTGKRGGGDLQGFDTYGGQMSAPFTAGEQGVLSNFLGSDLDLIRQALGANLQQDALGQAQMLLQPSLERTLNQGMNAINERYGAQGTLNSSNRALAIGDFTGAASAGVGSTLANLIPQLMSAQTNAAGALGGLTSQAMGLASIPRLVQQQGLDRLFQEFLRTTPSGGPLQALLGLAGGTPGGSMTSFGTSGFADILPALIGAGATIAAAA